MCKIISLEYETNAQNWRDGQFSIPSKIADFLKLKSGDPVELKVISPQGTKTFYLSIVSGLEIYNSTLGLPDHVKAGQTIIVKIILSDSSRIVVESAG